MGTIRQRTVKINFPLTTFKFLFKDRGKKVPCRPGRMYSLDDFDQQYFSPDDFINFTIRMVKDVRWIFQYTWIVTFIGVLKHCMIQSTGIIQKHLQFFLLRVELQNRYQSYNVKYDVKKWENFYHAWSITYKEFIQNHLAKVHVKD